MQNKHRAKAGGYILNVRNDRREVLLDESQYSYYSSNPSVAEPVAKFGHSKFAPLIVFASFQRGFVTHIGNGRKGASAGTGLVRLNISDLKELETPISFNDILAEIPDKNKRHLEPRIQNGGLLTPSTFEAFIDVFTKLSPESRDRIERFSATRKRLIAGTPSKSKTNLAIQKETIATALKLSGLDSREVLQWSPDSSNPGSFLDDLPEATVREDVMILSDYSNMPGYEALGDAKHIASKTFVSSEDPRNIVKVVMANRLPLEEQTGADLIYYNEKYKSFLMVQYKAMEKGNKGAEFRWQKGDQLEKELKRMDEILALIDLRP